MESEQKKANADQGSLTVPTEPTPEQQVVRYFRASNFPRFTEEDREDMKQEARLKIWQQQERARGKHCCGIMGWDPVLDGSCPGCYPTKLDAALVNVICQSAAVSWIRADSPFGTADEIDIVEHDPVFHDVGRDGEAEYEAMLSDIMQKICLSDEEAGVGLLIFKAGYNLSEAAVALDMDRGTAQRILDRLRARAIELGIIPEVS